MPDSTPGPEWHWNGQEWLWWNGSAWQEAGVAEAAPAIPPPPPDAPTGVTIPPPAQPIAPTAQPTYYGSPTPALAPRRGLGGAGITAIILGVVLALVLVGGGVGFVFTQVVGGEDDEVVTLTTEPISTSVAAFTPSVGTDTPVTPPPVTAVQTIPAETVGLFGGTLDAASCDKAQLVAFLAANPDKATVWAQALGIAPSRIASYVAPLTSVLLRSDTAVTNHGFEKGKLTTFPSVLQAGTAVLVNQYGQPVVKCNCGNPLTPPPVTMKKVKYKGPTWPGFTPGAMTIVSASTTVINNFTLVNVVNNTTFVRPAGTDGTADTTEGSTPAPEVPVTPDPVQPIPVVPAPEPIYTEPEPEPEYGRENQAISLVQDSYRTCAAYSGDTEGLEEIIAGASYWAAPVGTEPGAYSVNVEDSSGLFVYLVNVDTGSVSPTNEGALAVADFCPGVYD